jgi:hypothetical protein
MIPAETARRVLTPEACAAGTVWGGYLCYEEDCKINIVIYEKPELFAGLYRVSRTAESMKAAAWKSLSMWEADYLIARGIAPEPEAYAYFLKRRADDARRAAHDPDYIVSASDLGGGVVKVWTADQKEYFVTADSYRATNKAGGQSLAACVRA